MDRLSNIPSEILSIILEILPLKDAIRTSVLSKEWRHKWCSISQLEINYGRETFKQCIYLHQKQTIRSIVNQYLHNHDDSTVNKFSYGYSYYSRSDSDPELNKWINYILSTKHVKALILNNDYCFVHNPNLPYSVFSYGELNQLKLKGMKIRLPRKFFKLLVSLHLDAVDISRKDLQCLIPRCHALERLTLARMTLVNYRIYGPKLKQIELDHITIIRPNSNSNNVVTLCLSDALELDGDLVVGCPALEALTLIDIEGLEHVEIRGSDLKYLEIHTRFDTINLANAQNLTSFIMKETSFSQWLLNTVPAWSCLERLSISSYHLELLDVEVAKSSFPSEYDHLSIIEVYDEIDLDDETTAKAFLFLLGTAPNLVHLTFNVPPLCFEEAKKALKEEGPSRLCFLKLRTLTVRHSSPYLDTILWRYLKRIIAHSSTCLELLSIEHQNKILMHPITGLRKKLMGLKRFVPQTQIRYEAKHLYPQQSFIF